MTETSAATLPSGYLGKSWLDRLESVAAFLAGEVPEFLGEEIPFLGSALEMVIGLFWPGEQHEDIWDEIKDDVKLMVNTGILNNEIDSLQSYLDAARDALTDYRGESDHTRRATLIGNAQTAVDFIFRYVVPDKVVNGQQAYNKYGAHLIPLLVATAQLDLSIRRELVDDGLKMFPNGNVEYWENELYNRYAKYYHAFRDLYPKWLAWRRDQIVNTCGLASSLGMVMIHFNDPQSGVSFEQEIQSNNPKYFEPLGQAAEQMVMSQSIARMASTLSSSFYLGRFVKGQEKIPPTIITGLENLTIGPVSVATLGLTDDFRGDALEPSIVDQQGKMERVDFRYWNSVDCWQIHYATHAGNQIGDPSAGTAESFVPPKGEFFCGFAMRFCSGVMIEVCAFYSGGQGPDYGNKGGWKGPSFDASVGPGYEMVGAQYSPGTGPSNTKGIKLMSLEFSHRSLVKTA